MIHFIKCLVQEVVELHLLAMAIKIWEFEIIDMRLSLLLIKYKVSLIGRKEEHRLGLADKYIFGDLGNGDRGASWGVHG